MDNENKIDKKTDIVSDTDTKPKSASTAKSASTSKSEASTKTKSTASTKSKSTTGAKSKSSSGTKSTTAAKSKSATGAKSSTAAKSKSASGTKSKTASKVEPATATESETEPKTEAVAEPETQSEAAAAVATETEVAAATESADTSTESTPEPEPEIKPEPEPEKAAATESEITAAAETANEVKPASKSKSKFNLKTAIICILAVIVIVAAILIGTLVSCEGNGQKYTVTFDTRGGTPISSVELKAGEKINRPSKTPTKEMSEFYDWFTDTTYTEKFEFGTKMPKHDITIYAGWIGEASVEVKLDANGGEFSDGETEYKIYGDVGATFAMPSVTPTNTGYAFGGWYTEPECTDRYTFTVYPEDNLTLYAAWLDDASYVYVSYYGNGALISKVPVLKNTAISAPDMFGSDIISTGWYVDEDMTWEYTFGTITDNVSLYTAYYTRGLVISGGVVTGYEGDSASVIVPNMYESIAVTEIGAYAFYRSSESTRITSVSLPSTITVIGEGAFYDCQYLVGVGLTSKVVSIGANAFYKNYRLKSIGDISAVTEIGEAAFIGCKVLGNITLSSELVSLGAYAFTDCASITSMVIPSAIQTIPDYLFSGCTSLKEVDITSTRLYSIAAHSFENCKALTTVTIRSQTAVTIEDLAGKTTFYGLDNVKILVPSTTLDFYLTAYGRFDDDTLVSKFEAI